MRVFSVLVLLFFKVVLHAQVSGNWDVEGDGYRGCIIMTTEYYSDSGEIPFTPSKDEASEAEKNFRLYLITYKEKTCTNPQDEIDSVDCKVLEQEFHKYIDEYSAFTSKKDGHKYIRIRCLSPWFQEMTHEHADYDVFDGGPVLFHVLYDLTLHKVIYFRDNGWG